jgi:hypothetical protein
MASPYTDAVIQLDGNGNPIYSPLPFMTSKRIVFAGGTTNAIGDYDGTGDPFTVFTVTGDVMCFVVGVCKETLVGAATLELGVTGATAALLAQVADATTLVENEVWHEATPSLAEAMSTRWHFIGGGLDIIGNIGTANITDGTIDFYCFWRPLSTDGRVVAA